MTDAIVTSDGGSDSGSPVLRLREAVEGQVNSVEQEIAIIERLYRQLQTRINEGQDRRESADSIRQHMLRSLSKFGPEEIRNALDEHTDAIAELALAERESRSLADRRAAATERLLALRTELELIAAVLRLASATAPAEAQSNLRNASRQVFQVIEQERMRIARDMHDGPAQSMSNLVLQAEILERLVSQPEALMVELQDFKSSVRNALDETRQLIFDLRPMTLDDLGLIPTLRKYTREYSDKHGIQVRLHAVGEEQRLPGNIEGTLFRIIQEALTNVQKHSRAQLAEVTLNINRERVLAIIKDDGQGFDVLAAEGNMTENRNLGLISMRERCELEHGVLEVRSEPGKGTEIRAEFRLQ
jgi:two-component system, NarL family, sensor histidine kinase DegS